MSFIESYTPSTIDKIIGNNQQIASINGLMKEGYTGVLCIVGPQNIGKTNSLNILLKNNKYRIKRFDVMKNKKNIVEVNRNGHGKYGRH